MAKINSEKQKKSSFNDKKSLVGLNPVYTFLMTQVLHRSSVPLTPAFNFTNRFRAIVLQISEKIQNFIVSTEKLKIQAAARGPCYMRPCICKFMFMRLRIIFFIEPIHYFLVNIGLFICQFITCETDFMVPISCI
jgi:hypothetical protein